MKAMTPAGTAVIGTAFLVTATSGFFVSLFPTEARRTTNTARLNRLFSSSEDRNSVGDYVQGVHGGKYQFEEAGGATLAGRQFAESLYSSGPEEQPDDLEEPMPRWAERMGKSQAPARPLERYPILSVSTEKPVEIVIANDERSWERYYSKICQVSQDGAVLEDTMVWCHEREETAPLLVSPPKGQLAPRGGSSNLCDPSKPYSDSARIQVQAQQQNVSATNYLLLIVGTEAQVWNYWVITE